MKNKMQYCSLLPDANAKHFKRWLAVLLALTALVCLGASTFAQTLSPAPLIVSLAFGNDGSSTGTTGTDALNTPLGVAVDSSGNVFFSDNGNDVIREIPAGNVYLTPTNVTSTSVTGAVPIIAGTLATACTSSSSNTCGDGGPATSAGLDSPYGVAVDSAGNVYIAGRPDPRVRVVCMNCVQGTPAYNLITATNSGVTPVNGDIYTVAGNATSGAGYGGDGGSATSAQLSTPSGVSVDSAGNLYIADTGNERIRVVCNNCSAGTAAYTLITASNSGATPVNGDIYTVAGNGTACASLGTCGDSGLATSANLDAPYTMAMDTHGNLFIDDRADCRVRVVYVAGQLANISSPTVGNIYTYAGTTGTCATTAYSGNGGAATSAELGFDSYGMALDSAGNVYIADGDSAQIREVNAAIGIINNVAGDSTAGGRCTPAADGTTQAATPAAADACGDGGLAASSTTRLYLPESIAVDSAGNIYIGDKTDQRIREVYSTSGSVLFPATRVGSTSGMITIPVVASAAGTGGATISIPTAQGGTAEYSRRFARECPEGKVLTEVGRFRVITTRDLAETVYDNRQSRMERDLAFLREKGLIHVDTVNARRDGRGGRVECIEVVTLTKGGQSLVRTTGELPRDQKLYAGLVKPREVEHDAQIYRAYLKEAERIERKGGSNLRVQLDFELKSQIQKAIHAERKANLERGIDEIKQQVARQFDLPFVDGGIQIPDARIEYDLPRDPDRDIDQGPRTSHEDIEVLTAAYRPGHLRNKAQAGFHVYASSSDRATLTAKIENDHHLMERILEL